MGNYANRDRRHAEGNESLKQTRIAMQIDGLGLKHRDRAFWLFCPWCARRRLTDVAWVSQHIRDGETFAQMLGRMPCLGCGRVGLLNVIAALLTVTGYSTNDTIVIFDRVRENLRGMRRDGLNHVINVSLNQTLGRTVLTAGTALMSSVALFPERTHLVGAYALGKAQRVMALLRKCGWDKPIFAHGALMELTRLYQEFGVDLGDVQHVTTAPKSFYAGGIVLCPPSALQTPWARRFPDPVNSFASGWMRIRARARQQLVELPLVISDHADWNELTGTIDELKPSEVWITHGAEEALLRQAALMGYRARALSPISPSPFPAVIWLPRSGGLSPRYRRQAGTSFIAPWCNALASRFGRKWLMKTSTPMMSPIGDIIPPQSLLAGVRP